MLEVLVLKNAVECTSQRLKRTSGIQVMTFLLYKWTSGARVMIIFDRFTYKCSFSLYLGVESVLELLVLKNAA